MDRASVPPPQFDSPEGGGAIEVDDAMRQRARDVVEHAAAAAEAAAAAAPPTDAALAPARLQSTTPPPPYGDVPLLSQLAEPAMEQADALLPPPPPPTTLLPSPHFLHNTEQQPPPPPPPPPQPHPHHLQQQQQQPRASAALLPEVTLSDALRKIGELKRELAHAQQTQQTRIDALTQQLVRVEQAGVDDMRRARQTAKAREALLAANADPALFVSVDAVDAWKRDAVAELNAAERGRREHARACDARVAALSADLRRCAAEVELARRGEARQAEEAALLRATLEGRDALAGREGADERQRAELLAELLVEVRDELGGGAKVDAVLLRALGTSRWVKGLDVDVAGLLGGLLEGFDVEKARGMLAADPEVVAAAGEAGGGGGGGDSPAAREGPAPSSRLEGGLLLVQRAMELHRAAEDLRRSQSAERGGGDSWELSPLCGTGAPGGAAARAVRDFLPPPPQLPQPPASPEALLHGPSVLSSSGGGVGGPLQRPPQQHHSRPQQHRKSETWADYWQSWKEGERAGGAGGGGRPRSATPPARPRRRAISAPHKGRPDRRAF